MFYRSVVRPVLFRLAPETAHELALHALTVGLKPEGVRRLVERRLGREPFGKLERFGLSFGNPVGLAAGFDKNGAAARELAALGFGFLEVGTVTHLPQGGNSPPRLFRLPQDRALINRQGFNNAGAAALASRLRRARPACVLGINIGKSRAVEVSEAVADYLASFELVYPHADYITVNVSSPNTPGLRELQRADALTELLAALQTRNEELSRRRELSSGGVQTKGRVPLLVKVAPDLEERELELIVDVARRTGIDGIIATNTTTGRADLTHTPPGVVSSIGAGGLSGAPLRARSTEVIRALYRLSRGEIRIIGVGGIFNAADAWEKICAGACLVQLYTGFIYEGLTAARDINEGLAAILRREGFHTLDEAVGCSAE
ncbi:MAG TPA: quinone-dependent dihydroorotate dehydrogenase [Pyrinomonadaceae bacterium]|jgi:dihydroorotate dehydrogenase|nr:quinone-dependent dihydroorotate dehydrogenase [Pyrinomonadaceae bacterium]